MKLLDFINSAWALPETKLIEMTELYLAHTRREKLDLKAWEAATGTAAGTRPDPYTVVDGVAILDVVGVMVKNAGWLGSLCGMTGTAQLRRDLQQAVEDFRVRAIIVRMDSPGGTVDGTQEFADAIFAVRGVKPIVTLADGCMCSAAYWAGSAAEQVYITSSTTETGSIGVVATHVDVSRSEEVYGRKTTEITAGKFKRIATQYAPLTEEGRATIQDQVDYIYTVFVESVAKNRGVSVETVLEKMADGRVFLGNQAIEAGLVDGVSTLDALIADLSQGRTGRKAGAGAAQSSHNPTSKESVMKITREELAAMDGGPELLNALVEEGKTEGRKEGTAEGAAQELARVQGCFDAGMVGYEDQARTFALDGKTQPGEAALAINGMANATLQAARKQATEGGQEALEEGGDAAEADAKDKRKKAAKGPTEGQAFAAEIRNHIAAESAKGRKITALQAAAELKQGKE